jgi:hypothetical protein
MKVIQTFFLVVLCVSIPLFQTCLHCGDLAEADFLFPGVKFESSDLGSLIASKDDDLKLFLVHPSVDGFLHGALSLEQFPSAYFPPLFLHSKLSILRC